MAQKHEELRCLIAAGGTAGHVLPALAVADALRRREAIVTFAGSPDRAEARLVPEAGYELDTFAISGLPRRPGVEQLRAVLRAARSTRECARIVARRKPHVVLGAGGYVAGPVVYTAWRKRIPAALTEADAHLGLANRLAAPFARRVFLSFPIEGRDGDKYAVTGRPIPERSAPVARERARELFDLPATGPALLVFGGSQGAAALNDFAVDAFGEHGPAVLHLCGDRYYEALRARVSRPGYRLLPFTAELGAAYASADLALARAGGSVWELAAAGLPAVLVPSPNVTADHQTKNAAYFERGGGAVVVPEPALGASGRETIERLLADDERRRELADGMRRLARPDAADRIAEELIALARAGR